MNARMALMRPLRAATFKTTPSSPSSLLAARVSRSQQLKPQTRSYSSGQQQKTATGNFYKTFTRPVFKTALLAIFTYQLIYYAWVRLETDEIKVEKQAEVQRLEKEVKTLHAAQVAAAKNSAGGAVGGSAEEGKGEKSKSWYKFW
ncbi:hypothetical protein V8F20_004286 [Naviculisporaceae sp. PSN 640]